MNNIQNERYGVKDSYNIVASNIPNYNINPTNNTSVPQQTNYLLQQNNMKEINYQNPNTQRIQNFQAEQTRQKYHIHQVPAYKSIFDE